MNTKIFVAVALVGGLVGMLAQSLNAAPAKGKVKTVGGKPVVLWKNGEAGVNTYRIPALCTAPDGKTLVAAIDARHDHFQDLNREPWQKINIMIRTSKDGGKTWTPQVASHVWKWEPGEETWAGSDPSFIVDQTAKKIFLFYNVAEYVKEPKVYKQFMQCSEDNGKTWSEPKEITKDILPKGWGLRGFNFITSGSGVQLKDGTLLHTIVWVGKCVALFGSEDHGETWKAIGNPTAQPGDECKVVELSDGRWMINSRKSAGARDIFVSSDRGQSWDWHSDANLLDPACNAQLMSYPLGKLAGKKVGKEKYPESILLFSNCKSRGRNNLTLRTSWDDGETWSDGLCIEPGATQYSDMCLVKGAGKTPDVGIIFEGPNGEIRFCTIKSQEILKK